MGSGKRHFLCVVPLVFSFSVYSNSSPHLDHNQYLKNWAENNYRDRDNDRKKPPYCREIPAEVRGNVNKRWIDVNAYTSTPEARVEPHTERSGDTPRDVKLALTASALSYDVYRSLLSTIGVPSKGSRKINALDLSKKIHWKTLPAPEGYRVENFWYDGEANPSLTTLKEPTHSFAVKFVPLEPALDLPDIIAVEGTKNMTQWKGNFSGAGYPNALGLMHNSRSGKSPQEKGFFLRDFADGIAEGRPTIATGHSLGGIILDYSSAIVPAEVGRLRQERGITTPQKHFSVINFNSGSTGGSGIKGMNARSGALVLDTLPRAPRFSIQEHYEAKAERINKRIDLVSRKIEIGKPYYKSIPITSMPRPHIIGPEMYGDIKSLPQVSNIRFGLGKDPLSAVGNPLLGNYFPGLNVSIPVTDERVQEIKKRHKIVASKKKRVKTAANIAIGRPAGIRFVSEKIGQGMKKLQQIADYHGMAMLKESLTEDYLLEGIEDFSELQKELEALKRPSDPKVVKDISYLKKGIYEMQSAFHTLYCL